MSPLPHAGLGSGSPPSMILPLSGVPTHFILGPGTGATATGSWSSVQGHPGKGAVAIQREQIRGSGRSWEQGLILLQLLNGFG